jgi:hypothetical protein
LRFKILVVDSLRGLKLEVRNVHLPLPLLNSKYLLRQNKNDHIETQATLLPVKNEEAGNFMENWKHLTKMFLAQMSTCLC